jgi:BlaI family transcriptional regulator, penicillinase repressor
LTSTKRFVYTFSVARKAVSKPKPTKAELAILNILWRRGSGTVRDILADCEPDQAVGYTTVLKLLQIMTDKGLVRRDESERAHVYRPALKREETQGQIVGDLLDRVFGGSAAQLVLRALSDRRASKQEIAEIRRMLDTIEKRGKQ